MKTILVTGDRGYIGAVLVPALIESDYHIIGIDNNYFQNSKTSSFKNKHYFQLVKDIRRLEKKDLYDIEAIIHLAALSNDPMGELSPKLTNDINYLTTIRLAAIAKEAKVKRFIFSSSCSIYGITEEETVNEKSKTNPLTAYAKSKIKTEKELKRLANDKFTVGILRNSTVYGFSPRFRDDLVVNNLVSSALAYGKIIVLSDGSPWRPLIDVRDLSKIFEEFLLIEPSRINGEIINIGFAENNYRVKDIVKIIKALLPKCETVFAGEHGKDTRSYKVNFAKFRKIFPEFKQTWPLKRSIKDLIIQLKKINYGKKEFETGKYTRLKTLKLLTAKHKIDKNLYLK